MATIWTLKTGSNLGIFAENATIRFALPVNTVSNTISTVKVISGSLPGGLRIEGLYIVGTPFEVERLTESKFVLRATDSSGTIEDRTYTILIDGADEPEWITKEGLIAVDPNSKYFVLDNTVLDFQLQAIDPDLPAGDTLEYFIADDDGELPPGTKLTTDGRIVGLVEPVLARPWTLSAWVFLTVGIGLGSWWAYYELGWGGFWFWDPVENASLMPWLISVALLHSAIVVEKRDALKAWTILLAILAFGFSLIGTFIVRSGVLTSVHAFANDPERGVFILLILVIFVGGSLLLFAFRAGSMESKGVFTTVSRESALVVNNLLLVVSCFVVFVGTVWPLVAELISDRKLSVGPPFFNIAFTPLIEIGRASCRERV